MNRYTVVWDPVVERQFTQSWVAGTSHARALLTETANWIDMNLADDPDDKGYYRSDLNARIIAVPLSDSSVGVSVTFRVENDDRQVRVVRLVFRSN